MKANRCMHSFIQTCKSCRYVPVVEKARSEGREPTYEELQRILNMAIERTDYTEAQLVLDEFDRDLTSEELEIMILIRITRGHYDMACHAAKKAGRELTERERDIVLVNSLVFNNSTSEVVNAVSLGKVTPHGIRVLIEACLQKAMPQTAGFLAEKINHKFTAEEIDKVVETCTRHGHEERVIHAYLYLYLLEPFFKSIKIKTTVLKIRTVVFFYI